MLKRSAAGADPLQSAIHLAQGLLRSGDDEKAIPLIDWALAARPDLAHVHYLKAMAHARRGERGRALRRLRKSLSLDPGNVPAENLFFFLSKHADWRPSEGDSLRLFKEAASDGDSRDWRKLRARLIDIAFAQSNNKAPDLLTVQVLCALSHYQKACEALSLMTSSVGGRRMFNPDHPWDPVVQCELPAGYYARHLRALKRTRVRRELSGFLTYLRCSLERSIPSLGSRSWKRALNGLLRRGKGRYDFARYITGETMLFSGLYAEAVREFRRMLSSGYTHPHVHCYIGEALLCEGDVEGGLKKFGDAFGAASPEEKEDVVVWEGEMRLFLKQYRRAVALLKDSGHLYAAGWLGVAYLELGDKKNALASLRKAVASSPEDAEMRTWLGEAYRRVGRSREAFKELETAGRLWPNDVSASGESGGVWVRLNKVLLFSETGEAAAMEREFSLAEREWPELFSIARKDLGMCLPAPADPAGRRRIAEYILDICGGYRRRERHFLPMIIRNRGSAGPRPKGR